MNIKKQIILDDKDYERLVHDANLSNDEIKSKIASALTTDIVVSFDFDVNKKVTGNMRIVDIDGQEAERFDIRLAPNPAATIEQEALDVAGVTLEQVQSYQPMEDGYRQLVGILSKYVNKFDKRDKMYLVGYNNAGFDNSFLRALFQQCGDKYFGSWFYPNCMDVYVMVTPFLMGVRNDMENFKLMTVARTMGIEIDENKLHDATYDIELTRDIFYKIINKMDVKL